MCMLALFLGMTGDSPSTGPHLSRRHACPGHVQGGAKAWGAVLMPLSPQCCPRVPGELPLSTLPSVFTSGPRAAWMSSPPSETGQAASCPPGPSLSTLEPSRQCPRTAWHPALSASPSLAQPQPYNPWFSRSGGELSSLVLLRGTSGWPHGGV